jgi:hypothetical protein
MKKTGTLGISKRRRLLWGGLALLMVVGAGALVRAGVPNTFQSGDLLSADGMNKNFEALDQRIAALEARAHPASGFLAWLSTTGPTVQTRTFTKISFDQVEFDLASEYNPSTGMFTPKQGGTYLLNCGFWVGGTTAGSIYNVGIDKNGSELVAGDFQAASPAMGISPMTTTIATLAAGDKVSCGIWLTSSPLTLTALSRRSQFSAARLY